MEREEGAFFRYLTVEVAMLRAPPGALREEGRPETVGGSRGSFGVWRKCCLTPPARVVVESHLRAASKKEVGHLKA